jgi:hypothetical protein
MTPEMIGQFQVLFVLVVGPLLYANAKPNLIMSFEEAVSEMI